MDAKANVASIETVEAFRSKLIVYQSEAMNSVQEMLEEVTRTRLWLQNEQRVYWEAQFRRRTRDLEAARRERFSATISDLRSTTQQQKDVLRAEKALKEAEEKIILLKKWNRHFDSRVAPLAKQLDKLQNFLAHDLGKAAADLSRMGRSLQAYTELAPPEAEGRSAGGAPGGGGAETGNHFEEGTAP